MISTDREELLRSLGADGVEHNSRERLRPHLEATHDLLREWGARDALCDAGLFHSIYGTEYFQVETAPVTCRDQVRAVIGDEAERLVQLWCFGRRDTLAPAFTRMQDRRDGSWIALEEGQAQDLVDLWIADTLEQLPRVPEREVRTARMLVEWSGRALPASREALLATVAAYPEGA
jgi:hypothetical protein